MQGLFKRVQFSFQINYHSAGEWLLYPEGWQIGSPTADASDAYSKHIQELGPTLLSMTLSR